MPGRSVWTDNIAGGANIAAVLRERPYRRASETEDQMKMRRQAEREAGADEIERLRREHDVMRNHIMRNDPQWKAE